VTSLVCASLEYFARLPQGRVDVTHNVGSIGDAPGALSAAGKATVIDVSLAYQF
jgi:hypothetical protein